MRFPLVLKTLFALIICTVVMNSCKKDLLKENDGDNFIRFTFNGERFEYASEAFGNIQTTDGVQTLIIGAYKNFTTTSVLQEHISILVFNKTDITAGATYHDPVKVVTTDGTKMPQVIITYYDKRETGFQTVGIFSDENGVVTGSDLIPALKNIAIDAKVTVTELTNDRIKGSFSGTTYEADSWTDAIKFPITNGEFSVKRQR